MPMTRSELAMGLSIVLAVAVAGFVSTTYVDRHFAAEQASAGARTATPDASACIGEDGSWKNWPWPNVPALSPKC
jgi:hypothetical protein